jgi:ataxia telangiectasia mutated family protein
MRQDAVMEQVFGLVNIALRRDRQTSRRNLTVRRYIVIPLAEQAGILEFVSNTMPLADWLNNAHRKCVASLTSPSVAPSSSPRPVGTVRRTWR